MESTWNVVHDCDSEDGSPTCWAKRIESTIPRMGSLSGSASMTTDSMQLK